MAQHVDEGHPAHHFVPSEEYKSGEVIQNLRERIEDTTHNLSEHYTTEEGEGELLDYQKRVTKTFDAVIAKHGDWWLSPSERTVISLGRTFLGGPTTASGFPIVVKFNPQLRDEEIRYQTPGAIGNLAELQIWKYAVDNGLEEWFGTIVDYADDGSWVAMRKYFPYYHRDRPTHTNEYFHRDNEHLDRDYGRVICENLEAYGIEPRINDGDIGLHRSSTGKLKPIVLDYTAHTKIDSIEWLPNATEPGSTSDSGEMR